MTLSEMPYEQIIVERLRYGVRKSLSRRLLSSTNADVTVITDLIADDFVFRFATDVLASEIKVEKQWTDLVDEPRWSRWLRWITPKFLRRVTVRHYHNCPHIDIPDDGSPTSQHMLWLTQKGP